jgi:hypothetical protein
LKETAVSYRSSLALVCLLFASRFAAADDGPAPNVPGLAELSNYVGEWDVEITTPQSGYTTGHVSTKWILGGRFVEQSGTLSNASGSETIGIRTLITYDTTEGHYKSWTFLSTGSALDRAGEWDPDTKSFSYTGRDGEVTVVTKADFSREDTEVWQIAVISEMGIENVVISGINTRRE